MSNSYLCVSQGIAELHLQSHFFSLWAYFYIHHGLVIFLLQRLPRKIALSLEVSRTHIRIIWNKYTRESMPRVFVDWKTQQATEPTWDVPESARGETRRASLGLGAQGAHCWVRRLTTLAEHFPDTSFREQSSLTSLVFYFSTFTSAETKAQRH